VGLWASSVRGFVLVPCGWDGEFALEEMTTKER
jgi:hypothetical protein